MRTRFFTLNITRDSRWSVRYPFWSLPPIAISLSSNMAAPSTSRPPLREITTPNARPLAPIFTLYKRRAVPASSSSPPDCFQLRTPPSSSPLKHIGTRKRLRVREDSDDDEDAMSKVVVTSLSLGKRTAARRKAGDSVEIAKRIVDENPFIETAKDAPGVARRSRRRTIAFEAVTTHEFSQGLATGNRSLSYRCKSNDAYFSTLTSQPCTRQTHIYRP